MRHKGNHHGMFLEIFSCLQVVNMERTLPLDIPESLEPSCYWPEVEAHTRTRAELRVVEEQSERFDSLFLKLPSMRVTHFSFFLGWDTFSVSCKYDSIFSDKNRPTIWKLFTITWKHQRKDAKRAKVRQRHGRCSKVECVWFLYPGKEYT